MLVLHTSFLLVSTDTLRCVSNTTGLPHVNGCLPEEGKLQRCAVWREWEGQGRKGRQRLSTESLVVAMDIIGPVIAFWYLETERLGETSGLVCLT